MTYSIFIGIILLFFVLFISYLYIFKHKIEKLEHKIESDFQGKNNLIPALFEATKHHLIKHDQIFHELILLKKINFSEQNFRIDIHQTILSQQKIHKELDFIFRVCQKHPKLIKDPSFSYIKDLIFQRITDLAENIALYKIIIKKYNTFVQIKNLTLIGFFIPIEKKEEI